jgi:ADP-heptose:LPS heptosyltransferase
MTVPADYRVRRALVVRPRGLGDIVLSTAVVDAIGRAYPEVSVDYLSERSARALLECDDRLSRIFLIGPRGEDDGRIRTGGTLAAIRWIREGRPDLVVDLFCNPRTALLTALSGAPFRIGLDKRLRRLSYNVRVPRFRRGPEPDRRYALETQLDFLRGAGIRWPGEAMPNAPVRPDDAAFADEALVELGLPADGRFGAVLPGGSWESKRWSVEGFVAAGRRLAERFGNPTLVVWGPPERDDAERIADALGDRGRLAPPTTLRQMAALLGRPALLVATDCLGRHFAIVQGVSTVGLFGTTDPWGWTPAGNAHRNVRGGHREGLASLRELPAAPVLEQIDQLLESGNLDSGT